MLRKTVEFSTPGTRLSVAHRQLVIQRPDLPKATLPIEDLGVVIVDDVRATYTQAVFLELLDAGATVLVTGRDHLPIGMMLPLDAHHVQAERHRAQVQASEPVRKQAWQAIVRAKINQQALVLTQSLVKATRGWRPWPGKSVPVILITWRPRLRSGIGLFCLARDSAATGRLGV